MFKYSLIYNSVERTRTSKDEYDLLKCSKKVWSNPDKPEICINAPFDFSTMEKALKYDFNNITTIPAEDLHEVQAFLAYIESPLTRVVSGMISNVVELPDVLTKFTESEALKNFEKQHSKATELTKAGAEQCSRLERLAMRLAPTKVEFFDTINPYQSSVEKKDFTYQYSSFASQEYSEVDVIDNEHADFWKSEDQDGAFILIEFKQDVILSSYTLTTYDFGNNGFHPRSWRLIGDDNSGSIIDERSDVWLGRDNRSITCGFSTPAFVRRIKLEMTGPNAAGNNVFVIQNLHLDYCLY